MEYQLREAGTGRVVIAHLEMANTLWQQTVGLLGRKSLPADTGLWLEPCNGIHTFAMRFPLDVVFLDASGLVLHVAAPVAPWRICGPVRHARVVVELPAGTAARYQMRNGMRYVASKQGTTGTTA